MDSASRPAESAAVSRYYCHRCDGEVGSVADDFTCPTCRSGFVEMVEVQQQTPEEPNDEDVLFGNSLVDGILGDNEVEGRRRSNLRRQRFTTRGSRVRTLQPERGPRRTSRTSIEHLVDDLMSNIADYGRSGGSPVGSRGTPGITIDLLVEDFVANLADRARSDGSRGSRVLLGNPGDYVWGRDGLDSVVSQLLDQTQAIIEGPPPLTKEKIKEIPTAVISQDHLDMKLQCSVCWEDFTIDEKVLKLTCDHMYHKGCIIPWLKLHGTCPICRKYLADGGSSSTNSDLGVEQTLAGLIGVHDLIWDSTDGEMASTSSDWPAQLGSSLPLPVVSPSSATQSPSTPRIVSYTSLSTGRLATQSPTPRIVSYTSLSAGHLGDQLMSTSPADVDPMETEHDQNLPAGNNTNNP